MLPGDGIGPVVTRAATGVLGAVGLSQFEYLPFGHAHFLRTGHALPVSTVAAIEARGVALLGAATTPAEGLASPVLALRRALGLDLVVRPAFGLVLVGHAFAGLYAEPEEEQPRCLVTAQHVDRVVGEAFRRARRRVTVVDKPTVLRHHARLFRGVRPPPGIDYEVVNADAFVADLLRRRAAHAYEVVVATSFVADVLSDLFAALDGGVGTAPSASLGPAVAVFEPVHGSAPRRAGELPPRVDPTGAIRAAAMLLDHLAATERGEARGTAAPDPRAEAIRAAVDRVGAHDGREPTSAFAARVVAALR